MTDSILYWNQVALDAAKVDFSSADPTIAPMPEQGGPTRTSRALAIVHLAMFDAYTAITNSAAPRYLTYTAAEVPGTIDLQAAQAAVGAAACLTLISLFPRQKATFLQQHEAFLMLIPDHDPRIALGLAWGALVANKMLADRQNDGSTVSDSFYTPSSEPGRHRVDPINPTQGFLGPLWGKLKPFGIDNVNGKVPGLPPPDFSSPAYATDYNAVLGKGQRQGGTRTPDETTIGLFWAYDGARNIGVPPRLYNQVVRAISMQNGATEPENARLFAMVNVAMADAGIQAWYEKYLYNIWRPIVGIREASAGWGPTGLGDGNAATAGDPYWEPLGAPRTNQPQLSSVTPGFPAYPSGHATFGTAALRVAALALGLGDGFAFQFVSDELDGVAVGQGGVRPRYVNNLTIGTAIEENILSRVYLGVHWEFDGREGSANGETIAALIAGSFPARA